MKPASRIRSKLSPSIQKRLNSYALAATAAGVGMLALTQSAEGEIVYTKTHKVIDQNGVYRLELNKDGIVDFLIEQEPGGNNTSPGVDLYVQGAIGNVVQGYATTQYRGKFADALLLGASIGPGKQFVSSSDEMAFAWATNHSGGSGGQWRNVSNRYLGLKFKRHGETHYGWARLSVKFKLYQITATLTGYAYETTPNKGIRAGQTTGGKMPVQSVTTETTGIGSDPKTLGALALGTTGSFRNRP